MKKLLVTAIGAAAAFGAFAGTISQQRIGDITATGGKTVAELNTALGNYWSEPAGATNTYTVSDLSSIGQITPPIDPISGKSLDIKTTFGKPLSVDIVEGGTPTNIPSSGLYFDSLVKFTVCEDAPADTYSGAKIIMWLQEAQDGSGNATGTNLVVRAGYLTAPGSVVATNYLCGTAIDGAFADAWHRVTIKAMADMTVDSGLGHIAVPGFAIFIDSDRTVISDESKWDGELTLTEAADHYTTAGLFPSMVQDAGNGSKGTLTCASFDGTGSMTDIVFTDNAPIAAAEDYVAPKAAVTINGTEQTGIVTLADAIDAANGAAANAAVVITLAKGFEFDAPVTIAPAANGVSVVLDFNGFVIENTGSECLITNAAALTVKDSSGGATGGIIGPAIYQSDEATELTIAGGNFWGEIAAGELAEFTISGGAFSQAGGDLELLGAQVAEGKKISETKNADNLYPVVDAPTGVAQIGESIYDTLAEALTAATAGQTIKLLDDVEVTNAVSTAAGTLDLGDYTLTLSNVTEIAFTGTGAKAIVNGDVMGVYHELTITAPAGENLTFDSVKFHASVKPHGSGALFTATGCQFLCDFDKKGGVFTDGSSEDVHSYGVLFDSSSLFTQADIVNNYFDQGRRAAVQASFAGDLYFYGNTVVADKLTSRVDGANTRYPALQTMTHGRVFIENNTFSGQYLGEAFCLYNKGGYRSTDAAVVFSGNTVGNGVNYLWGIYDVDKSGDAALVAPNLYFGANTVDANVDTTGCIYKTTVDGTDMNGVTYSHTPATLALPAGVDSVYAWTHAADATDFYVNGTAAANLNALAANDVVIAVPGATVTEPAAVILTADATLKNQYTAATAVAKNGATKYATFKAAVDAAAAGDTVTVLADCTESGMVTFNSGITISNNYTVALTGMYALRFANGSTPVTICGTGTLAGSGEGSPLLIGSNETTKNAKYEITTTYEGSVILDGNTITYSGSGNVIKVEYGTFTMNSGTVTAGGNRGVKADADVGNFTSTVIINGGAITSTKAAVAASADTGTAVATINGGDITGPLTCGQKTGTATLTIPGTSTAKFSVDQSSFCETGYETTQSGDWYVVTKVKPAVDPIDTTTGGTAEYADASAATAAAAAINADKATLINVADAVTGEAKSAYLSKVEAVADGTTVTIQFTAAAAEEAQAQADADNASLPLADIAAAESSADATIAATPGFYYTVESGTEPGNLTPGTPVLATGNTVKLSIPNKGAAGFYKIKVSPTK